jgi:acetyl esterase/lipase
MSVPELDPQIVEVLRKQVESGARPVEEITPEEARANYVKIAKEQFGEVDEVHAVEDRDADGVPVRIYRPVESAEPSTGLIYFHGGGWVVGSIDTHDGITRAIAGRAGCVVISVDYRLAPEHPYPAGPDDCEAAACWVLDHTREEFGTDRLLIGGESAGAHLAAVTLLRLRDKHDAVDRFLGANLVFGAYDLSQTPSQRGVGIEPGRDILDGSGFPLDLFLPGMSVEERRAPNVSPLFADLSGMPPALFTVGATDHLVDDTLFMAARWELAGSEAELLVYPEAPHGCIALPTVAARWFPRLFDWMRARLAPVSTPASSRA